MRESTKDYLFYMGMSLAVVAVVVFFCFNAFNTGYAKGYCEALGAQKLDTTGLCIKSDGMTVKIP